MTKAATFAVDFRGMHDCCIKLASKMHDSGTRDWVYCATCHHVVSRGADGIWAVVPKRSEAI